MEAVADVDDDQEPWPFPRNRFGVAFGLFACGLHRFVARHWSTQHGTPEFVGGLSDRRKRFSLFVCFAFAGLLGFQHETGRVRRVVLAKADSLVAVVEFECMFKYVVDRSVFERCWGFDLDHERPVALGALNRLADHARVLLAHAKATMTLLASRNAKIFSFQICPHVIEMAIAYRQESGGGRGFAPCGGRRDDLPA